MLEFILHYWIEVLFGLVVAAGSFIVKRTLKSFHQERVKEKEEFLKGIKDEIRAEFNRSSQKEIELQDQIKILKAGLLSIQRRAFEEDCKKLLDEHHEITLEEYEQITKDHEAYNSLGGNHNGDQLYRLVRAKVEHCWAINPIEK